MYFMIGSIIAISIIGTLSHFLYDITDHNKVIGLFAAVNESVWEHVKITLTPTLLWALIDGFIYGSNPRYFLAKFVSLLILIVLMPILYYGHKFVTKKEMFMLDILNFYIVIIASQLAFYWLLRIPSIDYIVQYISCVGLFMVYGGYMIHTLMPPKSFMFLDPITKKYGFEGHSEIEHKSVKKKK